jgi:hypothetical protein
MAADMPVPYWPAYLPSARADVEPAPFWPTTPQAEAEAQAELEVGL